MAIALPPRPVPARRVPMLAGAGVVAFALALFLVVGWPVRGWGFGALLFGASQALELLFARVGIASRPSVRGSGLVAFGMMFRGVLVMLVGFIVATSEPEIALAGVLVYAAAYTLELAVFLALFFSPPERP